MSRSRPIDAETLACAVAGEYAGRWARAAARRRGDDDAAPWLVDAFAGADLQRAALRGATVAPPALALLRAADEAFGGGARVVLVEEDPGLLARLEAELRAAGAGDRLRRTGDPSTADAGEVALVESPLAAVADRLADGIGDAAALVRMAPLGARGLPWIALEPLAMLAAADLLIRVPQEDFAKTGRFPGPLADFPPHLRRVAEGCSAMFADPRHGWLLAWRDAARAGGDEAALAGAVDRLRTMLADAGDERTTRATRVEAAGAAVHLLLASPHAEHALELNGAIADGGATPPAAPASKRASKAARNATVSPPSPAASTEPAGAPAPAAASDPTPPPATAPTRPVEPTPAPPEPSAVLDLFALPPAPEPEPRGPDLRAIADDLHAEHAGTRVPVRELLAGMADTGLAPEQVRTVLGMLKRGGRAAYRSLDADGAEIDFPAEPAAPPAPAAPKARKPRQPLPGVLGLFDDPAPAEDEPSTELPADERPPVDEGRSADEDRSGDEDRSAEADRSSGDTDAPQPTASADDRSADQAEAAQPSAAPEPRPADPVLGLLATSDALPWDEPLSAKPASGLPDGDEPLSLADAIFPEDDDAPLTLADALFPDDEQPPPSAPDAAPADPPAPAPAKPRRRKSR